MSLPPLVGALAEETLLELFGILLLLTWFESGGTADEAAVGLLLLLPLA